MWHELTDKAAFDKALQDLPANKLLVVDYYAPWCAVCKTAYSSLCRVADTQVGAVLWMWGLKQRAAQHNRA